MIYPIDQVGGAVMRKQVLVVAIALAGMPGACLGADVATVPGGVCELIQHPDKYHGKTVRLSAEFRSTVVDRSGFFDSRCDRGWIDELISDGGLARGEKYEKRVAAGAAPNATLAEKIEWGLPINTTGQNIAVEFEAVFSWTPQQVRSKTLTVLKVHNVISRPCSGFKAHCSTADRK